MTQAAILGHRRMLPGEWPALFRVAGITGLVKGRFHHQTSCNRAVSIMAFRAGHLTKAHRMHGRHIELFALLLVAFETDIRLGHIRENGIPSDMKLVTTGTGDIRTLVGAAFPADMLFVLMTGQAHAVLLFDRFIRLEPKIQYWRSLFSPSDLADMSSPIQGLLHHRRPGHTWSMTGLALQLRKRRTLIAFLTVFGLEDIKHRIVRIFIMSFDAGVSAFLGEGARLHVFSGSRRSGGCCWDWGLLLLLFLLGSACRMEQNTHQENHK